MMLARCLAVAIALGVASPAQADDVWRWRRQIEEASMRFGVPTAWTAKETPADALSPIVRAAADSARALALADEEPPTRKK